jgi:RNA ligase
MNFDLEILNQYVTDGWVERNDHPSFPISIYNYSRKTQYEGKWDEITKQCRGLILDKEGNVVAKSFDKFFNYEELTLKDIPEEGFEVFEKLDGSLGILFWYQGKWILASKGSFTSDQAIKGRQILNEKYNVEVLPKGYTTVVEIIYPENRIVCDYGSDEVLVVLSMVSNASGKELDYESMMSFNDVSGIPVVKKYDGIKNYDTLKSSIGNDREGYVVRFKNGFRMKIKGEEYVRLHRILTGFSNVSVWEYLKEKKNFQELLNKVPDEFDLWVKETAKDLTIRYENIEKEYTWIYEHIMRAENAKDRKVFAEYSKRYSHPSILFKMLDEKDYSDYIWKIIRPEYSKPFWQKEVDL